MSTYHDATRHLTAVSGGRGVSSVRLGCVKRCEIVVAKLLAAVIADEGAGLARLELSNLGFGLGLVIVLGLIRLRRLNLLDALVLVVFQPLQSTLNCLRHGRDRVSWGQHARRRAGEDVRPPLFLTASSARALSKPMSARTSRSDGMLAAVV